MIKNFNPDKDCSSLAEAARLVGGLERLRQKRFGFWCRRCADAAWTNAKIVIAVHRAARKVDVPRA
jgi:hypothetical protein